MIAATLPALPASALPAIPPVLMVFSRGRFFHPQPERSDAPFDVFLVCFNSYEGSGGCSCATAHMEGRPMIKHALSVTREQNFPDWYQAVVRDADMAETSPVRGCMVIKPWGYGVWERIQRRARRPHQGDGARELLFPAVHPAVLHRQGGRARRRLRQGDGGRHPPPPEE